MKIIMYVASFAIFLSSCVNVNNTSDQQDYVTASTEEPVSTDEVPNYILANIVDSIISDNPDYLNNDIKKNKVAKEIQATVLSAIQQDHSILTEIPLSFVMMMKKGSKYIIKFELSNIGNSGTRISNKYDIYFNVFTEMSEEEASELIEKHKYHLTFESISDVNNNLVLPSGRTFTDNPKIYKTEDINVCPGAFLLKDVKYSE